MRLSDFNKKYNHALDRMWDLYKHGIEREKELEQALISAKTNGRNSGMHTPKFYYGWGGSLLCNTWREGFHDMSNADHKKYGQISYFVAESMEEPIAKILAEALGGEFCGPAPR